jgi:hypothetical protein
MQHMPTLLLHGMVQRQQSSAALERLNEQHNVNC